MLHIDTERVSSLIDRFKVYYAACGFSSWVYLSRYKEGMKTALYCDADSKNYFAITHPDRCFVVDGGRLNIKLDATSDSFLESLEEYEVDITALEFMVPEHRLLTAKELLRSIETTETQLRDARHQLATFLDSKGGESNEG